jgi:predicted nucleic acid-binding Zn ribbon protein
MKICEWCSNEFDPNVSYQIYCSPECRELATKEKVNKRYQLKRRQKLSHKQRKCSNGCGTILSIYNSNGFCSSCSVNLKQVDKVLRELKGMIEYEKFD